MSIPHEPRLFLSHQKTIRNWFSTIKSFKTKRKFKIPFHQVNSRLGTNVITNAIYIYTDYIYIDTARCCCCCCYTNSEWWHHNKSERVSFQNFTDDGRWWSLTLRLSVSSVRTGIPLELMTHRRLHECVCVCVWTGFERMPFCASVWLSVCDLENTIRQHIQYLRNHLH